MINSTLDREQILTLIQALLDNFLAEVANYADYLQSKSITVTRPSQNTNFLLPIVSLGSSGETHISEQREEILANEIDSTKGWSLNPR